MNAHNKRDKVDKLDWILAKIHGGRILRKLFLTFDVEDFISENSIWALHEILENLKKHDLKALFFITGHMAEKLQNFPTIIDLLKEHQIGYHSSSHSVHPTIFEFTDMEDYEEAYRISLQRETAHINPLTGEIEGRGGIYALTDTFPKNPIIIFRAPGCCWSPPHTQALRDLGIKFDFSSNLSSKPIHYEGLTFYPYPILARWQGKLSDYRIFLLSVLRSRVTVLGIHPSLFVNQGEWDSIYRNGNPRRIIPPRPRGVNEIKYLFNSFDSFLRQIKRLEKVGLMEVTANLKKSERNLIVTKSTIEKDYERSVKWTIRQNYKPKFLRSHFFRFFKINSRTD